MAFNTNGAATAGPKGLFSTDPLDVRLQVKKLADLADIKAGSVYESIRVFCQENKKFYTPKNFDTTAPTANVEWQEVTEGGGSLPDELKDATYEKANVDFDNPAMHTPGTIASFYEEEEIDLDHTREITYNFARVNVKQFIGSGSTGADYRNIIRIIKDKSIFDLTIFDYTDVDCEVYFLATEPTISAAGLAIKENVWYKCKTEADYNVDISKSVEVSPSEVFEFMNSVDWTVSGTRKTDYEYLTSVMYSKTLKEQFDATDLKIDNLAKTLSKTVFSGYSYPSDVTPTKARINIDGYEIPELVDGLTIVWTTEKAIPRDTYIQINQSSTQRRLVTGRWEDWDAIEEQSGASQYALYRNASVIPAGATVTILYRNTEWLLVDYDENQAKDQMYDALDESISVYTETAATTPMLYPFKLLAETQDGRYACLTYDSSEDHRWSEFQLVHRPLSNIRYKFGTRFLYYFRNEALHLDTYISAGKHFVLNSIDYIDRGFIPLMHTFTWLGGNDGKILDYKDRPIARTSASGEVKTIYLRVVDNGDGTWSLDGDAQFGIQKNIAQELPETDDGYVYIALAKVIPDTTPTGVAQKYNSYYLLKDHPTYKWQENHWELYGGGAGSAQIAVNGTVTAGGYSIPNPTADELTAIYNAVVAGNSVQIVDKNNVYYQVVLADSMDGAINVEILYFSELAIIYSLEHDVVNIETKSLGGALPDDFTDVKYTSKEAEIDWSNPAWSAVDETVYEENPGYFMTFKTSELVAGNDDNDGFSVAIYDIDEGVDYVMFAPDAIPLSGFSDVKAGVWYKVTGYDDDSLYTGFEEVETAEVNEFFNAIKARGGYIADQDLYDYFTAEILTEKEPVDVTFGEKFAESEVKVKPLLDATETVLESNTIYNGGMLGDIDISLPASLDVTYITQVHFSTPEDAGPTFVYDERIGFFGDDCEGGVFTPIEWARYSIMIFFDGENAIGMAMRI